MLRRWLRTAASALASSAIAWLPAGAIAGEPLAWTRDPALVPWETMTTSIDPARQPARTMADLVSRRRVVKAQLDRTGASPSQRAAALVELGDLFRDEARIVLEQDAADPWRISLPTSPAWLQLELAARRYGEALALDPASVDGEGRLTLLQAVISTRLGQGDRFDDYVRLIRTYRGTPYVEMAKLAVGDYHFRAGDLQRARTAYRLVRENRDPELSSYARYRLASVHAALGEHDAARQLLTQILDQREPGPLLAMLRDGARTALANQLALDLPLLDLVRWIDQACLPADRACRRDVRDAAAQTRGEIGDTVGEAWLRTVDATEALADRLDARLELARAVLADEPVVSVLLAAEDACAPTDDPCRAEQAHAITQFYDAAADPDGGWLTNYVRLPRMRGRPDVQRLAAELARAPRPPAEELADFEALCAPDDARCGAELRVHLRAMYGRLDRLHDAAWLGFVDHPIPLPAGRGVAARAPELGRRRARAPELLAEMSAPCGGDEPCEAEVFEILVGYYAAIGEDREASWLIALKTLPALPIPEPRRAALREAAMRGDGGLASLGAMIATCEVVSPRCVDESRLAAEAFFRAGARHVDAAAVARFALFRERTLDPATFGLLVDAALSDPPVALVLARVEQACEGRPDACAPDARAALAAWYELDERYADRLAVQRVDAPPDLGPWQHLGPPFLRVVRTTTDPREAAARVAALCPFGTAECPRLLQDALATWYDNQGRAEDARAVRGAARGGGFVAPR